MEENESMSLRPLIEKGVNIPNPGGVYIAGDVDIDRISGVGVTLHNGCSLSGADTLICRDAVLGQEGPVTVENCQIGPNVRLKAGYFKEAVFLNHAAMGAGAHVREGTILEEWASGAHTVGLKQTILFPYVTLGSLINFCDCLMAGGTGERDHSEVGSSYIHFNFTPNQDKATASLIGDVPRGVMLNQAPIFLGGQGGLVGPARLSYGTVIAAGSIFRKDVLRPGRLIAEGAGRGINIPQVPGFYRSIKRIVRNNIVYIANLTALRQWYALVRSRFVCENFPEALVAGLNRNVSAAISERCDRMTALAGKMPASAKTYRELVGEKSSESLLLQKAEFHERWPAVEAAIKTCPETAGPEKLRDAFLSVLEETIRSTGRDYLRVIKSLDPTAGVLPGTRWLQGIVSGVCRRAFSMLPALGLAEE